ncbi:MAG: hypothetical protein AAGA48_35195 [Myxococcota bacterium]
MGWIWFAGECKDSLFFYEQLGFEERSVQYYQVYGFVPGASATYAALEAWESLAPGAVLYVEQKDGSQSWLRIADVNGEPVIVRSEELRTNYYGGWSLITKANYNLPNHEIWSEHTEDIRTSVDDGMTSHTYGPQSMWISGVEPSWWETRGESGQRWFTTGTDHEGANVAIASSTGEDACEPYGDRVRIEFLRQCGSVRVEMLDEMADDLQRYTETGITWTGIALTFAAIAIIATPAGPAIAAASLYLALGGAAATGFAFAQAQQSQAMSNFQAEGQAYCETEAADRGNEAATNCVVQVRRANEEGVVELFMTEPPMDDGECPPGSNLEPAGTMITSCQHAEVIVHTGEDDRYSQSKYCINITLNRPTCVRRIM